MRDYTERALDVAQSKGATYADIRIVRRENQDITVKNGIVQTLSLDDDFGFGVRVIANGAWGFASSNRMTEEEIDRIAGQAVTIAKASALTKEADIQIGQSEVHVDTYKTPMEINPFDVSLEDKIDVLLAADKEARAVKGLAVAQGSMAFLRETKTFASSEGSFIEQTLVES